jgi:hypothetical protein
MTRLVLAFVTSRFDYCNSVLSGLPQSTLAPLQRVKFSVRQIYDLRPHEFVTPGLIQLHRLPIQCQNYKQALSTDAFNLYRLVAATCDGHGAHSETDSSQSPFC